MNQIAHDKVFTSIEFIITSTGWWLLGMGYVFLCIGSPRCRSTQGSSEHGFSVSGVSTHLTAVITDEMKCKKNRCLQTLQLSKNYVILLRPIVTSKFSVISTFFCYCLTKIFYQ